jgi:hypothetical protein
MKNQQKKRDEFSLSLQTKQILKCFFLSLCSIPRFFVSLMCIFSDKFFRLINNNYVDNKIHQNMTRNSRFY